MVEPEPPGRDNYEPTNDPEAMAGTSGSADAIKEAIQDSKGTDLDKEIEAIKDSVNDGSYKTKYKEGTPERELADKLSDEKTTTIDYLSKTTGLDLSGDKPFDQSGTDPNSTGNKNSDNFYRRVQKIFGFGDPDENGNLSQADLDKINKKVSDIDKQQQTEVNTKSKLALELLKIFGGLVPAFVLAWKLKTLEEFLQKIAQSLNECDEVNYKLRTQNRLKCNTNNSNLKQSCICSKPGSAPPLQGICSTFDPTHVCGDYDYIFFEYNWWDLFAAVVHGAGDIPQTLVDWIIKNKWFFIIGGIVILAFLLAYAAISNYSKTNT